jgi:hypothetical protein
MVLQRIGTAPRLQGRRLVFFTADALLGDTTALGRIAGTVYVACSARTIQCTVRVQTGDETIEVPEDGRVRDIRRLIDIPGCRLAVRGMPLADDVFLASVLFSDDQPVVSTVDDVILIDVAGVAVPIRIDEEIVSAATVEQAMAQRLSFAARDCRLKIWGRRLDPAERIPAGVSVTVETAGEVTQKLTLCHNETGGEVLAREFSLGLTVAELVQILGGRMCVFYYKGLPIFDDPERPIVSYPAESDQSISCSSGRRVRRHHHRPCHWGQWHRRPSCQRRPLLRLATSVGRHRHHPSCPRSRILGEAMPASTRVVKPRLAWMQ